MVYDILIQETSHKLHAANLQYNSFLNFIWTYYFTPAFNIGEKIMFFSIYCNYGYS